MPRKMNRIGIFGGSFDPPHLGHLVIAELARRTLKLDVVYFVPAYRPPHKDRNHPSTASDRLRMTKLAIQGNRGLHVSGIEIRRKGVSYTVDTVRSFHRRFPGSELFLIIGSDSLRQFHTWKDPQAILSIAKLAVYRRPHSKSQKRRSASFRTFQIKGPMVELSSTEIRKRIQQRKTIQYMVRENVIAFINRNQLYHRPIP